MSPINPICKVFEGAPCSPIKTLKLGEYFKRKETSKAVYVKGEYDKSSKAFACHRFDAVNQVLYIKATKPVVHGFTF